MKTFLLIALILASTSALSLEITDVQANIEKCAVDAVKFAETAYGFYTTIKSGNYTIPEVLVDVEKLVVEAEALITDCGVANVNYSVNFSAECVADIEKLATLAEQAVKDFESKNIGALIQTAQAIAADAKATLVACESAFTKNTLQSVDANYEKCALDAVKFAETAYKFYNVIKGGNYTIPEVLVDVEALVTEAEALITDCGVAEVNYSVHFSDECIADIEKLATLAEQAVKDFESKNIGALIQTAQAIAADAKATLVACESAITKNTLSATQVGTDYEKCAVDAVRFAETAYSFYKTVQSGNYSITAVLADVEALLGESQALINDCGITQEYYLPQPQTTDKCVQDLADLAALAEKAIADYDAKNIAALLSDALAIYNEAKLTLEDCKTNQFDFTNTEVYQISINYEKCARDLSKFVTDLQNFLNIFHGNYTIEEILQNVNILITDAENVLTDCGNNSTHIDLNKFKVQDTAQCVNDLEALAAAAEQAYQDFQGKNYAALFAQVQKIYTDAQAVLAECRAMHTLLNQTPNDDYATCLSNSANFLDQVQTFYDGLRTQDIATQINEIAAITEQIPVLLDSCNLDQYGNEYSNILPDACIESLQNTAQTGVLIYGQRNDIFAVLHLIPNFVSALQTDQQVCPVLEKLF